MVDAAFTAARSFATAPLGAASSSPAFSSPFSPCATVVSVVAAGVPAPPLFVAASLAVAAIRATSALAFSLPAAAAVLDAAVGWDSRLSGPPLTDLRLGQLGVGLGVARLLFLFFTAEFGRDEEAETASTAAATARVAAAAAEVVIPPAVARSGRGNGTDTFTRACTARAFVSVVVEEAVVTIPPSGGSAPPLPASRPRRAEPLDRACTTEVAYVSDVTADAVDP